MATPQATKRLRKEHQMFQKNPPSFIWATPNESKCALVFPLPRAPAPPPLTDAIVVPSILEWHYIMRGPPGTPYEGGEYWGVVTFPKKLKMNTPSGRFAPSTAICTSMSNFHPGTPKPLSQPPQALTQCYPQGLGIRSRLKISRPPRRLTEMTGVSVAWSTETILVGLLSFMLSDEITTGAIRSTDAERRALAASSHAWNIAQPKFRTIFPEYAGTAIKDVPNMTGGAPKPAPPQGEGVVPASAASRP
ncbi:SPOSA6832_01228 [Sporobolomyces salmonicolor]|uniref:SPOSA6832_01228-mRNA-1:cds n=1 Tax=Sporidiobolus salmonicolor TaxID=5005 RepID=A0A0D6EI40_SPOSA|nr:SPOSA6832_01228 [Sporobolomyces salmonicolor]